MSVRADRVHSDKSDSMRRLAAQDVQQTQDVLGVVEGKSVVMRCCFRASLSRLKGQRIDPRVGHSAIGELSGEQCVLGLKQGRFPLVIAGAGAGRRQWSILGRCVRALRDAAARVLLSARSGLARLDMVRRAAAEPGAKSSRQHQVYAQSELHAPHPLVGTDFPYLYYHSPAPRGQCR
jgi:hypothetical protein